MKRFLAAMTMLFVTVMATWVAFRLAPETWAMIAGVVFGLVAALPMCAIVVILLLRGQSAPQRAPQEPVYAPPPSYVVLNAEPGPYGGYVVAPETARYERRLPAPAYPARPAPAPARPAAGRAAAPRTFVDRTDTAYPTGPTWEATAEADAWEPAYAAPEYEYEDAAEPYRTWEQPAAPAARGARILGR